MFPGTSTLNQVNKVLEVTGKPNKEDILSIQSELAATMLESIPSVKSQTALSYIYSVACPRGLFFFSNSFQVLYGRRRVNLYVLCSTSLSLLCHTNFHLS